MRGAMWSALRRLVRGDERLGPRGEAVAAKFLKRAKYRLVARNLTIGDDEADIIAIDPDGLTVVIVEVKARVVGETPPEEGVGPQKRHRLARLASRLLKGREYQGRPIRFDVVGVEFPARGRAVVRHHVAAFDSPW
jgi:putative endonuclease